MLIPLIRIARAGAVAIGIAGIASNGMDAAVAQDAAAKPAAGPPFAVSGFKYTFLVPGTHMFVCEQAACGRGSKVSYIAIDPSKKVTFSDYKQSRQQIAEMLKARAPAGTHFTFQSPVDKSDKVFRMFESRREVKFPNGATTYTISTLLYGPVHSFDVISTASDAKMAQANAAQFLIPAMLVSSMSKK